MGVVRRLMLLFISHKVCVLGDYLPHVCVFANHVYMYVSL